MGLAAGIGLIDQDARLVAVDGIGAASFRALFEFRIFHAQVTIHILLEADQRRLRLRFRVLDPQNRIAHRNRNPIAT